jgi:hypothetical protein
MDDNGSRVYGILWDVFNNVNGQLQFAETKNAALVTLNLAVVLGIGAILAGNDVGSSDVRGWLFVTAAGVAGGGLVSLLSFLPHLGPTTFVAAAGPAPTMRNLIFFADLAQTGPAELLEAVFAAAGTPPIQQNRLHESLAHQIVVNSGIASRKFAWFRAAVVATVLCAVIPAFALSAVWIANGGMFK